MNNIISQRYAKSNYDTLSRLNVFGREYFVLEPADPIPAGIYKLGLHDSPHFTPRYGHLMLQLLDVPGHQWILIHRGNSYLDTKDCQLVGMKLVGMERGASYLLQSTKAYDEIYPVIREAMRHGDLFYEIKDIA